MRFVLALLAMVFALAFAPYAAAQLRGHGGPVRAEPFNATLRTMPAEEAVATTARAMKRAFALLG